MSPSAWRRFPANALLALRTVRRAAPRQNAQLLAASLASAVALLALLLAGRRLLTEVSDGDPGLEGLLPTLGMLAAATAVASILTVVQSEQRMLLAYLVEREATEGIVSAAATVPLAEFESPEFRDHLQRSLREAVHRPWEVAQGVGQLVSGLAGSAAITVVLLTIEPLLVPAVLLVGAPLAWAAKRNSQTLYDAVHAITPLNRERQYIQEVLTGRDEAKELRVFGSARHLRARYTDTYQHEVDAMRLVTRIRLGRSLRAAIASTAVLVALLAVLTVMVANQRISVADGAVAVLAVQQLGGRIRALGGGVSATHEASLFLEDYADFLARARPMPEPPAPGRHSALEVKNLWFTYPGAEEASLRNVSLSLRAGELVALVGANGSGKTTLAKLVCGLYEPDSGEIRWSGEDARPAVGVIFQDFIRYRLSALENIGLADPTRITDADWARQCAREAGADDFLAGLPAGYATRLSPEFEGGTDLSVGQWQRVALARALFRAAPVLVLDEPTAALDPDAERELIGSTARSFTDKAVLVISHRFANVVGADRIYVLDHGEIVECGNHAELMERDGRYATMYRTQAATFGVRNG